MRQWVSFPVSRRLGIRTGFSWYTNPGKMLDELGISAVLAIPILLVIGFVWLIVKGIIAVWNATKVRPNPPGTT